MQQTPEGYMRLARRAKAAAYAPYSHFRVGACAVDEHGCYALGCNVENASYGATLCAERVAVGAAIAGSLGRIVAIYIASDADGPTFPCGICRQVLYEQNPDMTVYVCGEGNAVLRRGLGDLLPHAFSGSDLK